MLFLLLIFLVLEDGSHDVKVGTKRHDTSRKEGKGKATKEELPEGTLDGSIVPRDDGNVIPVVNTEGTCAPYETRGHEQEEGIAVDAEAPNIALVKGEADVEPREEQHEQVNSIETPNVGA